MNHFNLPKGLLDSVTNVLKTNPRDNTPLQEKLIKSNQSAVKSATDFDNAVSSIVAEGRKKEAERQAKFAESAAKAHKGMGKSIVESIATKEEVIKEEFILDESAFAELATRMKNVGNARRMQNMTEQKETIAQMTRTFSASFDQIVEANIAEMTQDVILALAEVKADIRTQMLHAVNVASAARVVDESAKIMAIIEAKAALKKKANPHTDAYEAGNLKTRHSRIGSDAVDEARSDGTVFDVKVAKTFTKKPGELTGHEAKKTAKGTEYTKKHDPVGKEDDDVNNDGKVNSSDSYLKNRRKAISANIKEEQVEEGVMAKVKSFVKKGLEKVGGGSDEDQLNRLRSNMGMDVEKFKKNTAMDVGSLKKRLAKEEVENVAEVKNTDTPGNDYKHQCAIHVKHSKLGEGKTLYSQHAQPDADGHIAWYDVMFEEGIKRVDTTELEILVSESHMNHKKKM